ncbi:substrate-binding domain-containing protein, partial [Saliniramus sp.]|uniref:substrate-binding domain-containing protein n=1 Tax=Saliniramus sp. TaxID=2986772 RepID=UPI002B8F6B9D
MKFTTLTSAIALATAGIMVVGAAQAQTRDQIRIVGSSTVFPYSQAAAEEYANVTGNPAPVVESTGTGGGMQIFCEGIGPNTADLTGASRAMKESEWALCQENGVTEVTEAQIGSDGLSIAQSVDGESFGVSLAQIFQALAAEVAVDGEI